MVLVFMGVGRGVQGGFFWILKFDIILFTFQYKIVLLLVSELIK